MAHIMLSEIYGIFIELDDGKIYRKPLYVMVKTMVSCRFPLNQSIDICTQLSIIISHTLFLYGKKMIYQQKRRDLGP